MDPLMISAASGMRSRMESLDLIANNVANSNTAGFKADHEFYSVYQEQDSTLPTVEKHFTDFAQGTMLNTGNSLDLALSGKGFFVVDTPSGPLYTRNGNFRLSPSGDVITQDGQPVRVVRPDGKPAKLDPALPVEIDPKGGIQQSGQTVGNVVVVDPGDNTRLMKAGSTYFKLDGPNPQLVTAPEVHSGSLESANVPVAESAVRLVSVMRQFEMLQKAAALGSDMYRYAVEEVAKVS